jgi:hypothetical protein
VCVLGGMLRLANIAPKPYPSASGGVYIASNIADQRIGDRWYTLSLPSSSLCSIKLLKKKIFCQIVGSFIAMW